MKKKKRSSRRRRRRCSLELTNGKWQMQGALLVITGWKLEIGNWKIQGEEEQRGKESSPNIKNRQRKHRERQQKETEKHFFICF